MRTLPFEDRLLDALHSGRDVTALARTLTLVGVCGGTLIVAAFLAPYALTTDDVLARWTPAAAMGIVILPLWAHTLRVMLGTRACLSDAGLVLRPVGAMASTVAWSTLAYSRVRHGFLDIEWTERHATRRARVYVGPAAWAHHVCAEFDRRRRKGS